MKTKKKTPKNKTNSNSNNGKKPWNIVSWIKSPQLPLVIGVFFFLLGLFAFVSFVSYYICCISQTELLENIDATSLLSNNSIGNWCGRLGAWLSYIIINNTFGFGSFGFVLLMWLISFRLLNIENHNFSKWIVSVCVFMLWISIVLGYIVVITDNETLSYFSGRIGVGINQILVEYISYFGALLVVLAISIFIPMILFGVKYVWVGKTAKRVAMNVSNELQRDNTPKDIDSSDKDNENSKEIVIDKKPITQENESKLPNVSNQENKNFNSQRSTLISDKPKKEPTTRPKRNSELPIAQSSSNLPNSSNELPENMTPTIISSNPSNTNKNNNIQQENAHSVITSKSSNATNTDEIPFTVNNPNNIASYEQEQDDKNIETITNKSNNNPNDMQFQPTLSLPNFQFPSTDILIDYEKNNILVSEEELLANKQKIVTTLRNYNIEISSIEATTGPTVTLYEIIPAPGIRISKIKNLEDDIALSLAAFGIRIIAPIPGKGTIGIEVPNSTPQVVSMKTMLESSEFENNKFELPVAIGKKIDNKPYVTDLAKMPHLLMAGATGQGKSVGLNAIIASLLYKKHPSEVKFIFVDPKKVELSLYSQLDKHYLAKLPDSEQAVITDCTQVVKTLQSLCKLMDHRYELLKDAGCKKITEYNKKFNSLQLSVVKGHAYMPYIVVVIDEFADLIMTAGKEIEKPICRLAQLARAVGIHLIIATQRPSVNIITGTIKANFPARAAFKVSSLTDSRTILDQKGAEQLVGRGDMLITDSGNLIRLQCALIDTDEIAKVVESISKQDGYADCYLLPFASEDDEKSDFEEKTGTVDEKFAEAAHLVVASQQGSTSMLQRKLSLGYNRAGRVMDQLECFGIVGPSNGSKPRDVLIGSEEALQPILVNALKDSVDKLDQYSNQIDQRIEEILNS